MNENISTLREHLFAALTGVKDGSLNLDQARAVNEISKTLVDTARVEVDYLRATGGMESSFIESASAEEGGDGSSHTVREIGRVIHKLGR